MWKESSFCFFITFIRPSYSFPKRIMKVTHFTVDTLRQIEKTKNKSQTPSITVSFLVKKINRVAMGLSGSPWGCHGVAMGSSEPPRGRWSRHGAVGAATGSPGHHGRYFYYYFRVAFFFFFWEEGRLCLEKEGCAWKLKSECIQI